MKYRLFSKNFFLVAVLVCVTILNFYPQRNYNAVMNPSKAIASTTDDVAEQVLVKSADDVAGRAVVSSVDDVAKKIVMGSSDDVAAGAVAGSRQVEKQLLSGSEWNEYFQQTYGAENVQWATKGQSGLTKEVAEANTFYHSANSNYVDDMIKDGFNIDFPSKAEAFARNRFGRGVYLGDSPATALAERPGGTVLKIEADLGKNLNVVNRGIIGDSDYAMTQAIARGARKHGYDSISFLSKAAQENGFKGINTMIFDPKRVMIKEVLK